MASSKRQTTMAKIAREQAVREKRARKAEKKEDKKIAAEQALLAPPEDAELELDEDGNPIEAAETDPADGEPNDDDPTPAAAA